MIKKAYEILGLKYNSDIPVIKKRFRELMLLHHPDKAIQYNAERFNSIVESYNLLCSYKNGNFKEFKLSNLSEIYSFFLKKFLPDIYIYVDMEQLKNNNIYYYSNRYCESCIDKNSLPCFKCSGLGYTFFKSGRFYKKNICKNCNGRGKIVDCDNCGGRGFIKIKRKLDIKNMKEITENKYILKNSGNSYKNYYSDVYIVVK